MTDKDLKTAEQLKQRLLDIVRLADFKVFGSRARGDADEYSDLDIFIEVEVIDRELKEKIKDIVWQVGFDNYVVISPLIYTRDEIENTPIRSSSIIQSISEEGVSI
jgi:predicted nucleotidyltransferase